MGGMSMPTVGCEVNTCTHWMSGSLCGASTIDILMQDPRHMARSVEQTECKTFALRRSVANIIGSMDNVNWGGAIAEPFVEGTQLSPEVTCVVETCQYWAKHDGCSADRIHVSGREAKECQDTHCATYVEESGRQGLAAHKSS